MPQAGRSSSEAGDPGSPAWVQELLQEAREALGMPVAFIARSMSGRRVIAAVDAAGPAPFSPGDEDAADGAGLEAHVGVPIPLADGTVYGTLCAYGRQDRPADHRDATILHLVARSLGQRLSADAGRPAGAAPDRHAVVRDRLRQVLDADLLRVVYQPIVDVSSGEAVALEALTRFPDSFGRSTAEWFADAAEAGQTAALELAAIRHAAAALAELPRQVALTVNASAAVVLQPAFRRWLAGAAVERLILELTDQDPSYDEEAVLSALAPARAGGLRVAVDEAGAGYASMRPTTLRLEPDLLKLNVSLIRDVDTDRDKRALCRAIVAFAKSHGTRVVAVGVETAAQLTAVRRLDVDYVQGFHLAQPSLLPDVRLDGYGQYGRQSRAQPPVSPEVAGTIREMALAGASPATIAARLNRLGELTPRGVRWHATSVAEELSRGG